MRGKRLLTLLTIVALWVSLASGTALAAPDNDDDRDVSTDGADLINMNVDLGDDDGVSTDGADLINEITDGSGSGDGDE